MIEDTVLAMFEDQAAITALVGTGAAARIFPVRLPQTPVYPAMTYQIISAPRDYTQEGADHVVRFRVQCNLYGAKHADAVALRNAVESSLSGLHNRSFGSPAYRVKGVFITNERDGYESALDQTPAGGPYRKIMDLMITLSLNEQP